MATKTLQNEALTQSEQHELAAYYEAIADLQSRSRQPEWGFDPISALSAEEGRLLLGKMRRFSSALGVPWYAPAIGTDGEGGISLEWRSTTTALTLFANADGSTESLFSWGANIWDEMETISSPDEAQLLELWRKHINANQFQWQTR